MRYLLSLALTALLAAPVSVAETATRLRGQNRRRRRTAFMGLPAS